VLRKPFLYAKESVLLNPIIAFEKDTSTSPLRGSAVTGF
jgi:hypothetical protein